MTQQLEAASGKVASSAFELEALHSELEAVREQVEEQAGVLADMQRAVRVEGITLRAVRAEGASLAAAKGVAAAELARLKEQRAGVLAALAEAQAALEAQLASPAPRSAAGKGKAAAAPTSGKAAAGPSSGVADADASAQPATPSDAVTLLYGGQNLTPGSVCNAPRPPPFAPPPRPLDPTSAPSSDTGEESGGSCQGSAPSLGAALPGPPSAAAERADTGCQTEEADSASAEGGSPQQLPEV